MGSNEARRATRDVVGDAGGIELGNAYNGGLSASAE